MRPDTIMLILAVSRKLQRADATVRAGGWRFNNPSANPNTYFDLFEKRVGIVGMGHIGKHVAKRLRGFECQMQYATRHPLSARGSCRTMSASSPG
jgi:lactate dehydrogenase-like 2-hydroxyacid dehydrogenase